MGLAGRKQKQRIGADPRNLTWADDAAKFGHSYLSKLGWDPSKGLGAEGDGRTSHIKVAQKLNLLGIGAGAAHAQGPEGVAWKQNRDFEALLARLNEQASVTVEATGSTEVKAVEQGEKDGSAEEKDEDKTKRKDKKEKRKDRDDEDRKAKKKRRTESGSVEVESDEDGKKKKKKSKKSKEKKEGKAESSKDSESEKKKEKEKKSRDSSPEGEKRPSNAESTAVAPAIPRHRAHRARFLAAKRLVAINSTAVSEILGLGSSTASPSSTPFPRSSEPGSSSGSGSATPALGEELKMEQLTIATKSVADYFKEKLAARAARSSGASTPTLTDAVQAQEDKTKAYEDERPRMGLGMRTLASADSPALGFTLPGGLASMFAKAAPSTPFPEDTAPAPPVVESEATETPAEVDSTEKKKKREKKKKDSEAETESKTRKKEKKKKEKEKEKGQS